jgi:hypothetical protein
MDQNEFDEPTENDKELTRFVIDHCDRWRDWRDTNYLPDYLEYERIFRGEWAAEDKTRESERSRIVTPATQQAVETRHAEIMEAIFGQGELKLPPELAGTGPIRVVHFWDPDCPCNAETDAHLRYLIGLHRNADVAFYSVQKPGSQGEIAPFLRGRMKPLPGIEGMESLPASPALAIWDRDGKLAYAGMLFT